MQEEIGHPSQRGDALGRRAAGDGVLELGNDGIGGLLHLVSLLLLADGPSQGEAYVGVKNWNSVEIQRNARLTRTSDLVCNLSKTTKR
jgi:hypothetical protein